MRHSFIDRYSELESPIHRLDPRTKFICLILFVLTVVTTPAERFQSYGAYGVLILGGVIISKVPFIYVLKRIALVLPFIVMTVIFLPFWSTPESTHTSRVFWGHSVSRQGMMMVWNVTAKSLLAAAAMILLASSTQFSSLLTGMASLRVPKVMLLTTSFMYRYLFVATDEAMKMETARESRYCGRNKFGQLKVLSNMIGLLFIRAYERAERVYQSMVSRGYDGEARTLSQLRFAGGDVLYSILFVGSLATVRLWGTW